MPYHQHETLYQFLAILESNMDTIHSFANQDRQTVRYMEANLILI